MNLKKYKPIIVSVLVFFPLAAFADIIGQDGLNVAADRANFNSDTNIYAVVARWINGFLSIFGIVSTYFLISAGFEWMTSGGNAEKIDKAKQTIKWVVLGVFIALIAYSLTRFILYALFATTVDPATLPPPAP